jgi:hypothetical protein
VKTWFQAFALQISPSYRYIVVVNGRNVTSAAVGDSLATLDAGHGVQAVRLTAEHRWGCTS